MLGIHIKSFKHLAGLSYAGLAGSSAAFLLIMAAMLFTPAASQPEASATENNSSTSTSTTENSSGISTYATTPTVEISLPASIDFADVLPTLSGATTTATADLTITTSDSAGYSLYLYSSEGDNSLKSSNPANISKINATAGDVGLTLSSLKSNTWGYNLGTSVPNDNTTYSAVPTDNSTPIQTKDTSATNSANDTYTLSFGAKVDSTIASGAYSNALTVAVVAEPRAIIYIQDLTLSDCQSRASDADFTVTDRRDDNDYTVRYINGACWMTQNLRISSTTESGGSRVLTSADSNVTSNWTFPNNSLRSGDTNYIGKSYTEAGSVISDDPEHATEYGGYYNYCAASAGTVCNDTTKQNAAQDICPKGWRLPTLNEMNGITSYRSAFSPVYSGRYSNGSLYDTGSYGDWWSATASRSSSGSQYYLYYYGGSLSAVDSGKHFGFSVRCIRSNPGTLTINFDGNGSTGGSTASQQIAAGNSASLNTNGFTRNGYAFTGWNTAADGSGTSYADGADYTVTPATGNTTVTLYAQWEELVNVGYIQDFTNVQCQAQASSRPVVATDRRDNNTYTLRYINGACWMTQNLRLSSGRTLTPANSNVDRNWSFPITQLDGSNPSFTAPQTTISSNTSYGGYYNYCAASAGTVCNDTTEQDADQDICPKGWRLPTLDEMDGITGTSYVSAFSPVYSGIYEDGSLFVTGSYGYWWSSTAVLSNGQERLRYFDGSLDTSGYSYRDLGYSVRCIRSS